MNKLNTQKRDCRASAASTSSNKTKGLPRRNVNSVGSSRAFPEHFPEKFYITVTHKMGNLLLSSDYDEMLEKTWQKVKAEALTQIHRFKQRYRVWKHYGFDPGDGFVMDYTYDLINIDGIIQLLRLDMIPISAGSIDALMDVFDGKGEFAEVEVKNYEFNWK